MEILIAIIILAAFILILYLKHRLSSASHKGWVGERRVYSRLLDLPDEYNIFDDVMIPKKNGKTTQIDHIVVSPYGIFVIETKNYQGIIIGNGSANDWKQNIWGNEYKLFNPAIQNYAHIAALKQFLPKYSHRFIHNIVTFPNETKLNLFGISEHVVHYNNLRPTILTYSNRVLTDGQMHEVINAIHANNILDKEQRKAHIQSVKLTVATNKAYTSNGLCPHCGGKLMLRNGKYGQFYGCSNYPNCKFTKK